jgi:lipoprotein-releasing system ATP-binding protein
MIMENNTVLSCENLSKSFKEGELVTPVLKDLNFSLQKGEYAAIVGRSGSGKTTLLHMLAGLDLPDSGRVTLCGKNLSQLSINERALARNEHMGFVYQFHHLLPEFNALENVMMPLLIAKTGAKIAKSEALTLLERIGLKDRAYHRPSKLSGGERQRVAIARALVNRPDCVLADEPTGNLDSQNAENIQQLILELNKEFGLSFLLVTHDETLASQYQKVYRMEDGVLV